MALYETGRDAFLSCGNVKECDQIQWWFRASQYTPLVQIPPPLPGSTLTNRQICWRDCTLALLRVQEKDAGLYICTQRKKELVQVHLTVLTGEYHLGLLDAEEQCSLRPQSDTILSAAATRGCDTEPKNKFGGTELQRKASAISLLSQSPRDSF